MDVFLLGMKYAFILAMVILVTLFESLFSACDPSFLMI